MMPFMLPLRPQCRRPRTSSCRGSLQHQERATQPEGNSLSSLWPPSSSHSCRSSWTNQAARSVLCIECMFRVGPLEACDHFWVLLLQSFMLLSFYIVVFIVINFVILLSNIITIIIIIIKSYSNHRAQTSSAVSSPTLRWLTMSLRVEPSCHSSSVQA